MNMVQHDINTLISTDSAKQPPLPQQKNLSNQPIEHKITSFSCHSS